MDLRTNSFTLNDTKITENVVGWKTIPKKLPIPVKELKYSTKGDESEIRIVFAFYDSNNTLIEQVENYGTNGESMTIVAPENSSKFLVSCLLSDENEKVYISDGSYLSLRVRNYSKDLNSFYTSFGDNNFQEEVVCDEYSIANYGRFELGDTHELRKIINGYNNTERILLVNYAGYSPILNTKILNNKKIVFCGQSAINQAVNSFIYDCNDLTNGKTGLKYVYDVIYRNGKYYILSSQSVNDVYYLVIGETNGDDFSTLVFTRPTFSITGEFIKSGSINFKFNIIDDNIHIIFKNQGSGTSVVSDDIYSVNLETKELTLITRTSGFSILDVYGNYMAINASGTLVFEYVNSNYVPTRTLNTALTLDFNAGARRVYKLIYDVLNNQFLLTGSNLYKFDKEFTSCEVVTNISYTDTSVLNYRYLNLNNVRGSNIIISPLNTTSTSEDLKEIYSYDGDTLSFVVTPNEGYKITGFSDIGIDCKTELLEDGSELIVTIPAYSGNTLAPSFEVYTETSYPIKTGYYYLKEPNLTEEVNVSMQQLSIGGKTEKSVQFTINEIFVNGEVLDVSRDDISRLFYVENEFQAPNLEFMSYMEECKVNLKAYRFDVTLDRGFSSYTMTGTIFPYKEYYVAFNKFLLTFNLKNGFEVDSIKSNRGTVFSNNLEYYTQPMDPEPDTGRSFKFRITATSAIDYIEISLYNNTADPIVVDKTGSLERIGMIRGTLKANTDIMNPVIQFEYVGLPNFNYVYIDKLKRYYYVENIINNNLRIWTMNLRVDVLNSFKEGIGELYANVERNEYDYNNEIEDNLVSFTSERKIYLYEPDRFIDDGLGMEQIAFDEELVLNGTTQTDGTNVIINLKGNVYTPGTGEVVSSSPSPIVLPQVSVSKNPVPSRIILTNTFYLNDILARISESESTFVKSIIALPFNFGRCFYEPDSDNPNKLYKSLELVNLSEIKIKDDGATYQGNFYELETTLPVKTVSVPYIYHYDFIFNHKSARVGYLKKEPYTTYEIFIPYVGWREISSSYLGDRIQIVYSLNIEDGTSNVNVIDYTKNLLINTYVCQLGIRVPINTTNNEYLSIQKQQNTNNMIMSTLSTGVNATVGITAGVFSGNPIAMAGGVMSATRAITSVASSGMNYHNSNMSLIEKAQCTISSGVNGNYCLNRVMIKETYNETTNEPVTRYYGKPLLEMRQLKNLKGMTKVGDIIAETSYPSYITNSEKNEIKLLLKDKVFLPWS